MNKYTVRLDDAEIIKYKLQKQKKSIEVETITDYIAAEYFIRSLIKKLPKITNSISEIKVHVKNHTTNIETTFMVKFWIEIYATMH